MANRIESIERFIDKYGIDENVPDSVVYDQYKNSTKHPHTKTMFTQYLKKIKGIAKRGKCLMETDSIITDRLKFNRLPYYLPHKAKELPYYLPKNRLCGYCH